MEFANDWLKVLLSVIAIGQFVSGIFFWYCGLQVKMLRLELVSKRDCEAYREKLRVEANAIHTCVSNCKNDIAIVSDTLRHIRGDHNA